MFKITVVRFRDHADSDYIGRGSLLGNPFPITPDNNRNKVCDLYEDYFYNRLRTEGSNSDFINELRRLYKKGQEKGYLKLGCFCAPQRCHGLTIKNFFDKNQNLLIDFD